MIPTLKQISRNMSIVCVSNRSFYFSFNMCVAYQEKDDKEGVCLSGVWSKTTRNHMKKMGVSDWNAIPENEFEILLSKKDPIK